MAENNMTRKILNIGHLSTIYHSNFILMNTKEIEKDLNLKINWSLFGTGPGMIDAFSKEEIEAGYMGLPPAIIGINNKIPIKCVAGGHVEGTIMIGKPKFKNYSQSNNSLENVLSQFKGKVIGVTAKGSIHDVIIRYYLKKFNLIDKIELVNYDQAEFIAIDMKKGLIEGGVGTPSLVVFASSILKSHMIIGPDKLLPYNPSYGIFFHENIIKNEPNLVERFLVHHINALNFIRSSKLKAAQMISKIFKVIDEDYANTTLSISPKYCAALLHEYINSTMDFVKILKDMGYITKKFTVSDIFNTNFIKKIHPEPHHYNKFY